jgi:hypothetical protein
MRGHLRGGGQVQAGGHRKAGALRRRLRHGARMGRIPSAGRHPKKAAIIGSGPAGLACAGELARNGVQVTIFEALHVAGGVLKYGIPEFRLPDVIIDAEIDNLKKMGVEIRLDTIIGKLFTIPQLLGEMGYHGLRGHRRRVAQVRPSPRRSLQRRLFGQRIPHPREPDARLSPAPLRHAGGHGQTRGRGGRGQYRHGCLPRGPAHGRRIR